MAKKTTKKKASKRSKPASSTPKRQPPPDRPFPRATLEEAVKIPLAIRHKNGGNPWDPSSVATAIGQGKGNAYFYLTAASRDFGLTIGTRDTAEISLTELGKRLAFAETPEDERSTRLEAFLNVELFKKVLEYYNGSSLPEMKYLQNTLESKFSLDPRVHEEFASLFRKNCEYLKLTEGIVEAGATTVPTGTAKKTVVATSTSSDFVTVAEPETETGLTCFVAMPFSERDSSHPEGFFSEVLRQIIAPAGRKAGFRVVTARKRGSDVIHATIVNGLLDADLVVADLTEHNPNVLFELGMRMADDKPVALIRAAGTKAIFDVDNMLRVEEYSPCLWPSTVEADMPKIADHIDGAWQNRDDSQSYMKILRTKREQG
ncbi:MAG: hypothetical protein ACF787_08000 [Rhodopirellula sp. JB053]